MKPVYNRTDPNILGFETFWDTGVGGHLLRAQGAVRHCTQEETTFRVSKVNGGVEGFENRALNHGACTQNLRLHFGSISH